MDPAPTAYRDTARQRPDPDADIALVADYRRHARRVQLLSLPLLVAAAVATFAFAYASLADILAARHRTSWPYGVAMTAAVLTVIALFAAQTLLRATLFKALQNRWIRAAASRYAVDEASIAKLLF